MKDEKFIIYQLLPRTFGNPREECTPGGTWEENGSGRFADISDRVLEELRKLSVTHIWYTGVIEHATRTDFSRWGIRRDHPQVVKGEAGSPYAIKDYYDVNPYLAENPADRMAEFEALLRRTHRAGCRAIIDFVPNHLAREYGSDRRPEGKEDFGAGDRRDRMFDPMNNFYYLPGRALDLSRLPSCGTDPYREEPARATGNDCFSAAPGAEDWYETVKLNYGVDPATGGKHFDPVPKTWRMMLEVLLFWAGKGVDGFRCDMAEMVPVEFWNWALARVKAEYPQVIFIAEIYRPDLYRTYIRGGFDYLYDKVGLYDTLKAVSQSVSREWGGIPASAVTGCWQTLGTLQPRMLNFLENHDEQRIASPFNLGDAFRAMPELTVSLMLNTAPFMLYAGQEFGETGMQAEGFSGPDGRSSIFDYSCLPSAARFLKGLRENRCLLSGPEQELYGLYAALLRIAMQEDAVRTGYTYDLEYANADTPGFDPRRHFVFARRAGRSAACPAHPEEVVLAAVDFSGAAGTLPVKLPRHFFQAWNLPEGEYLCRDLLAGPLFACDPVAAADTSRTLVLRPGNIVHLPVKKYGVCLMKFMPGR